MPVDTRQTDTPHSCPNEAAPTGPNSAIGLVDEDEVVDETTALLRTKTSGTINGSLLDSQTDASQGDEPHAEDRPLPKTQVLLLCFARVIEPLAFFSIFPYVNQMVQENGSIKDTDVGFYSGLIESLFSLTQAIVMIYWGRAADRIGRKPVLVYSLFGVTLATGLFGFAKTIPQMILFRCIAGVFAGTIVTIRTMVAEHSTSKTQARAFSWFAFSGNLGIFLGPLMGGALAEPATQYPGVFGGVKFLEKYPYALSSLVVALVGGMAAIISAVFIEETLKKEPLIANEAEDGEAGQQTPSNRRYTLTTRELIKSPGVGMVLYVYGHIMTLAFAYTAIVPVFWFTRIDLGGWGFTPLQISLMMGLNGAAQACWLLLVFPPLQHRIGTKGVIRLCALVYPFFFLTCVVGNLLLRAGTEASTKAFWVLAPIMLAIGCGVSMSFTAIQLSLNDVSPSPQVLGLLNAMALTGVSTLRAFCPALFSSLFAVQLNLQLVHGYAIWIFLAVLASGLSVAAKYLPEPPERR
ncbi:Efflux pump azaK [Penicillium diatomitis]|uniref:Efflux pump azaK n=1 Tax=Penicillium diatomitis TaxID=2819901 RepID=A0A9W9XIR4_9EURO|nr:Efflux pump azaK [Penicillium diatomitis]KAJ5493365.1 Efflux pump azaK [Penicillium diatomitis]